MKLVGERRAISALIFSLFFLLFLSNAVLGGGETAKMMYALAGCYGLAAFSLIAGYFWARWYAVGTGIFGLIVGVVGCWQLKTMEPIFVFFAGIHLVAALALWGETMSVPYDGQTAWREKFHMDENAVQRLGRSVIRAGVSLPFVLLYALVPKQPGSVSGIATVIAVGLVVGGFAGLVKMKTWGVLALGAAGALLVTVAGVHLARHGLGPAAIRPALGGSLLVAATAPFATSMLRMLSLR